jgi:hypothetical protein
MPLARSIALGTSGFDDGLGSGNHLDLDYRIAKPLMLP